MRKESGFSFLDATIQKHLIENELSNNINEINDDDDFDNNNTGNNNIMDDIEDEKNGLGVLKDYDNENEIEGQKNNIDNDIFNKIKNIRYDNFENNNKIENKGIFENDNFGCMKEINVKPIDENYNISFGK